MAASALLIGCPLATWLFDRQIASMLSFMSAAVMTLALGVQAGISPHTLPARQADPAPVASFMLPNGLKVVVQPDRRVPIVTVTTVYDVGSKDEKLGQSGYAHLFEHLMLDGSLHWNQNADRSLRDMGAVGANATTTQDRTIFYATVPRAALERMLFLEADRMGYLAEALTSERVAREVDVVLNEKRQRGSAPYGEDWAAIFADLYPPDHPYHHNVIGDEKNLRAATVDDTRQWFRDFYGPANATLILTGDVTEQDARSLVTRYFGALAARPPIDRLRMRQAALPGPVRRQTFQAVPATRIYTTHPAPPAGSPAIADLDLIAQMIGNGSTSRLHRRLVDELKLAKTAMVTFNEKLLSSEMGFVVDGIPPDRTAQAEAEIDATLARFAVEGPTREELDRARTARLRYSERLQNTTFGKAFALMRGASLTDDPDYATTYSRQLREATPERVRRVAAQIYGAPGHRLIVSPVPPVPGSPGGYDPANGPPPMADIARIAFPTIQQTQLSNGLVVVLVPRAGSTTADVLLRINTGTASAPPPVPSFAVASLAGAGSFGAPALAARMEALGGQIGTRIESDHADLTLSADAAGLRDAIGLLGEQLARRDVEPAAIATLRQQRIAGLRAEWTRTGDLARRLVRNSVYGDRHPYGAKVSATEDVAGVEAVDALAVRSWLRRHVRPDRAILYVAADTNMSALRPLLETALAGWKGEGGPAPDVVVPSAVPTRSPSLIVVDHPGARQTFIAAGRLLPPSTPTGDAALDAANEVYGGNSSSRIGTNLRQERGWTYGIGSGTQDARGERLWQIAGSVAPDHSGAAVAELIAELRALGSTRPPDQAELDRVVAASVNEVASRLEDNGALLKSMADAESFGRPRDIIVRRPGRYRALTLAAVRQAARTLADPSTLHWVVIGDWQRIREQFGGLGFSKPTIVPYQGS